MRFLPSAGPAWTGRIQKSDTGPNGPCRVSATLDGAPEGGTVAKRGLVRAVLPPRPVESAHRQVENAVAVLVAPLPTKTITGGALLLSTTFGFKWPP